MTGRGRFSQIGIDRLVRLEWMEKTATLALAGVAAGDISEALQHDLESSFRSQGRTARGSLDKTITVLRKVWVNPPGELSALRSDGLMLLGQAPRSMRLAVHWGMVMAVYPFWSSVAVQVGRLLRLQDSVTARQVQRRVRERYGQRETVSRRTRYVLRSFVDWGVMADSSDQGVYGWAHVHSLDDPQAVAWLMEAQLHAGPEGRSTFAALMDPLSLFPFRFLRVGWRRVLSLSDRLELLPDGSGDEMIGLRQRESRRPSPALQPDDTRLGLSRNRGRQGTGSPCSEKMAPQS